MKSHMPSLALAVIAMSVNANTKRLFFIIVIVDGDMSQRYALVIACNICMV